MNIVVYTGSNCPQCQVLKRVLNQENVQYEERAIFDYIDEATKLGLKALPSVVIYNDGSAVDIASGASAGEELVREYWYGN